MKRIGFVANDVSEAGVRPLHSDLRDPIVDPLARGIYQIDRVPSSGGRAAQRL
jgi:hypothetical protein